MTTEMERINSEPKTKSQKPITFPWSWAYNVVIAFVLFCSFVIYIVVRAFQQDVDLVSKTYYLDELRYQQRIEEHANLAQSGLKIALQQTQVEIVLDYPEGFSKAQGEIHFYHPSRELFDKRYAIAPGLDNRQQIAKEDLIKGRYKVKINWTVDEIPYFQETEVFLK